MLLKIPWIDRSKCRRELECPAAKQCKKQAFELPPESEDEPGKSRDYPWIDLEKCKQCGDCEKACPERAVKMV